MGSLLAGVARPIHLAVAAIVCVITSSFVVAVAAPPEVTVELVDHDGLTSAVTAAKGKVVVLDCWSTSCPPCVKEFPGLVALHEKYSGKVACLSLSLDYEGIGTPDEVLPPVKEFLESQKARFRNLLAKEDSDAMCKKLGIVSVPAIFIYTMGGIAAYHDVLDRPETLPLTDYKDVHLTLVDLLNGLK